MVLSKSLCALALALPALVRAGASYSMVKEYAGTTFFDDWDFYGNCEFFFSFRGYHVPLGCAQFAAHLCSR